MAAFIKTPLSSERKPPMKFILIAMSILTVYAFSHLQPQNILEPHYAGIEAVTVVETPPPATVAVPSLFARTSHENQSSICKNSQTGERYRGLLVTAQETTAVLLQAGFNSEQARIMTAISHAESGSDMYCWGDETLQNRTWRESYGLFQVRLLKNPGGSCRNYDVLKDDLAAQAGCAKQIFDGQGYGAWSVYTNGKYRQWLDKTW